MFTLFYVQTFFSLLILFLILLTSPVQLYRSSHFICLLMNNVLLFITMRTRVPITCLFTVWFIIKSRAKKSIAKLFFRSSGTDWRPLQLPELSSLKKVHFTKLSFTLLRCCIALVMNSKQWTTEVELGQGFRLIVNRSSKTESVSRPFLSLIAERQKWPFKR